MIVVGRTASPPRIGYGDINCYSRRDSPEALRLLAITAPATPSGSGLVSSEPAKDKQHYTMLVNASGPASSKVTAEQLRYIKIHNTPTHLEGRSRSGGGGGGKKSTSTVSWRIEPHELHTYSPENDSEQTILPSTRAIVDLENGYTCLGKNAEANPMPSYDQLMHHFRDVDANRGEATGRGSFTDFPSSVI